MNPYILIQESKRILFNYFYLTSLVSLLKILLLTISRIFGIFLFYEDFMDRGE